VHIAPQPLSRSACPGGTGAQVPTRPAVRQLSQLPVQARSQQTPSAQAPETHSVPSVQLAPVPFFPQRPSWQRLPAEQEVSPVQVLKQSAEAGSQA
jgi:hypothetical protein